MYYVNITCSYKDCESLQSLDKGLKQFKWNSISGISKTSAWLIKHFKKGPQEKKINKIKNLGNRK